MNFDTAITPQFVSFLLIIVALLLIRKSLWILFFFPLAMVAIGTPWDYSWFLLFLSPLVLYYVGIHNGELIFSIVNGVFKAAKRVIRRIKAIHRLSFRYEKSK